MARLLNSVKALVADLWRADARLTGIGLLMVAALGATAAGLWFDPRLITGAPAWLKPAKFAASIAIYTLTMACVLSYLPEWARMRRVVSWTSAVVFTLEMVLICVQAWRGTASHFNVSSPLNATVFTVMGLAIIVQTLVSVAAAVALWRQPFDDRALGWALRLGLAVAIVGASTGGLMTRPTNAQLEQARLAGHIEVAGAHTVGAPDGGPGLVGTGWSVEHGDLRVAHFVGLHAFQVLPAIALLLRRRAAVATRVRLIAIAAASYVGVYVILLSQALRGQSFAHPDDGTLLAFGALALVSTVAGWLAMRNHALSHANVSVLS